MSATIENFKDSAKLTCITCHAFNKDRTRTGTPPPLNDNDNVFCSWP